MLINVKVGRSAFRSCSNQRRRRSVGLWPVAVRKVMNVVAPRLPALIGGSADLSPSTYTALSGLGDFDHVGVTVCDKQGAMEGVWSYVGLYLYFEVREHDIRRS
jgi:transketolase